MTTFVTANTKLYIGTALSGSQSEDLTEADFTGQTWTEIKEIETFGTIGDTANEVTADVVGNGRTRKFKGTFNAGNMEVVALNDTSDPGQIAVLAASRVRHNYAFRIVFADAPPVKSAPATITIDEPGVISWADHGLAAGAAVKFVTTGALPTGLTPNTTYYVLAAGLTDDAFSVAATAGGAAIETTGTQSGVHTASTVPKGSERLFAAKVMSAAENLDGANSIAKFNMSLGIDSNVVRVAALG